MIKQRIPRGQWELIPTPEFRFTPRPVQRGKVKDEQEVSYDLLASRGNSNKCSLGAALACQGCMVWLVKLLYATVLIFIDISCYCPNRSGGTETRVKWAVRDQDPGGCHGDPGLSNPPGPEPAAGCILVPSGGCSGVCIVAACDHVMCTM